MNEWYTHGGTPSYNDEWKNTKKKARQIAPNEHGSTIAALSTALSEPEEAVAPWRASACRIAQPLQCLNGGQDGDTTKYLQHQQVLIPETIKSARAASASSHTSPETQVLVSMTTCCIDGVLDIARGQLVGANRAVVKAPNRLLQLARGAIAHQLAHDGRQGMAAQQPSLLRISRNIIWQFNGDGGHDKPPSLRQLLMSLLQCPSVAEAPASTRFPPAKRMKWTCRPRYPSPPPNQTRRRAGWLCRSAGANSRLRQSLRASQGVSPSPLAHHEPPPASAQASRHGRPVRSPTRWHETPSQEVSGTPIVTAR